MASVEQPSVTREQLDHLCRSRLGSPLERVLFTAGYSSRVFGVELVDGSSVVLKWRRWRERLLSCHAVQQRLWAGGFRCPEPLGPPYRVGDLAVSAEAHLPGGASLGRGDGAPGRLARVLADLVAAAPSPDEVEGDLQPDMGFLRWSHPGDGLWPPATDVAARLDDVREPAWLDDLARAARDRLAAVTAPAVVGHGDWWSDNVRWDGPRLLSVDDWDSVVALPEATLVGAAAALHADGCSTVAEIEDFLAAYAVARGRTWSPDDLEAAWAAGLWARLFDARKDTAAGRPLGLLRSDAAERADRAGLGGPA